MKLRVNGIKTLVSQGVHKVLDKKGIKAIKPFYKMALLLNVMKKIGLTLVNNNDVRQYPKTSETARELMYSFINVKC